MAINEEVMLTSEKEEKLIKEYDELLDKVSRITSNIPGGLDLSA